MYIARRRRENFRGFTYNIQLEIVHSAPQARIFLRFDDKIRQEMIKNDHTAVRN